MTTLRKLYTGALRLVNVVSANEDPTAGDMEITKESFEGLLQSLQADFLNIYTVNPYRFPLVAGQQEYLLGPGEINNQLTGANWVLPRPMRVERAVLLQGANIAYAVEPTPPANVCCFLNSQDDDNVIDLWLFNDNPGSGEITSVKSYDNNDEPLTISLGGIFSLSPSECDTGLDLSNEFGYDLNMMYSGDGLPVQTYEFNFINTGEAEPPASGTLIFRLTWMYYEGEGAAEVFAYLMPGNYIQFRSRSDPDDVLSGFGVPVGETVTFALQFDIPNELFSFYANGGRIFDQEISAFYGTPYEPNGSLTVRSSSAAIIDNLRRSDVVRYSGTNYNPFIEGGSCPTPEAKPNEYTWYGSVAARNGYDGDVGLAGYIPTVPLVQIPIAGLQTAESASRCRSVMAAEGFGPILGGGDRNWIADDGSARPMPIGETYTATALEYGFYSTPFYFPAKPGDSLWVTAANFTSGVESTFTIQVGPYGGFRESYDCVIGSQPYEPITFSITRTA